MVWLEGRGVVPGTRHGLLPVPGHNACVTPIPARHSPSAGGLCPAAAQAAGRQPQTCLIPACAAQLQPQNTW